MSISFAMHQKTIVDAYNQVIDDKNELNWYVLSYIIIKTNCNFQYSTFKIYYN